MQGTEKQGRGAETSNVIATRQAQASFLLPDVLQLRLSREFQRHCVSFRASSSGPPCNSGFQIKRSVRGDRLRSVVGSVVSLSKLL